MILFYIPTIEITRRFLISLIIYEKPAGDLWQYIYSNHEMFRLTIIAL